jgi:hypothetical protein
MAKTPQKITLTFKLYGSDARKRTVHKWLKALEKNGALGSEIFNLYECQTAFMTPEQVADLYGLSPEDIEETG